MRTRIYRTALLLIAAALAPYRAHGEVLDDTGLAENFSRLHRSVESRPAGRADTSPECAIRKSYLDDRFAARTSVEDASIHAAASGARIVFLAERHYNRPIKLLDRTLSALKVKEPEFDCLLMEIPVRIQNHIDAFVESDKAGPFSTEEQRLFSIARRLKMRVLAADIQPHTVAQLQADPRLYAGDAPERDEFMARTTAQHLERGSCHKAVFLVGKGHVMPTNGDLEEGSRAPTVPERLRSLGIAVSAINVIHRGALDPGEYDELSPRGCTWNLWDGFPNGSAPFGFLPVAPGSRHEYDSILIAP